MKGVDVSKGERRLDTELVGGPFRDARLLKRDDSVETSRAVDRDGREIVIKSLHARSISLRGLALGLEAIADITIPGTALPIEIATTMSGATVTRPFVAGPTLRERLADGPVSVDDALAMASALLDTLGKLHARGIVHGGIKPSNIVLAGGAWTTPVLVDLGFARHMVLGDTLEDIPLEVVRYLAPEQAGLLERRVDGRADLHALGLTLYEAIARPPFSATAVSELLRLQLTATPVPLSALAPGIPEGFDRIVQRLLRKDPRDRYQTATGVRADVEALASALRNGDTGHQLVIGANDVRETITEPAFTGRHAEIGALTAAIEATSSGDGGIMMVEGESGSGKTWLLEEVRRRALDRELWLLRGHGTANVAPRPYHVLSAVARDIVSSAAPGSVRAIRLVERAGSVGGSLVEALPMLNAIFGAPTAATALDPNAEERSFAALTMLLDVLGSAQEPAVVLIDDAQWADPQTVRVLERWNARHRGTCNVLVILAFRSEEVGPDHPLRRLDTRRRIELGPLSNDEVRQQVMSMAGELPRTVVELVADHAAGNPLVVTALLHGLVESQVLHHGAGGWKFAESTLAELQLPSAHVFTSRIERLPPATRRLLSVGALLGKSFDPILAGELCSLARRDVMMILHELRGRLVWIDRAACVFVHDRIRETLLSDLGTEERERIHLEAANRLPPDRVFELAYHYDAAGAPERALTYALEAAERAKAQHDVDLAERYYRASVRGLTETSEPSLRFRVARGLGDVLLLRSQYDESERWFNEAFRIAPDQTMRADVEDRRAQLALKRGDVPAAIEHGENALRLVGRYVPRATLVCFLIVMWEALVQVLHTRFPRRFVGRRTLDGVDDEMFAIHVLNGLNGPYFFARGAIWVLWAHLRALNLSERYPASRALGREYANHGSACAGFPSLFERAIRYTRRGAEICAELGDVWGQARALQFHALSLCATGRCREAIEAGERGGMLFDRAGDVWNAQFALNWASLARYRIGDLVGCVESAKQLYARGRQLDSALGISFALDAWVRAVEGQVPADVVKRELDRPREHIQTWSILAQSEAIRLLAEDRPAEAEQLLETWLGRMKQQRAFFHESNVSMIVYLAVAQRRRAELAARTDPSESARLLKRALRTSRRATRKTRRFRNCMPHALREAALTEAMAGHVGKARTLLDASIDAARQLDARFELALSREARGELGPAIRGTELASDLEAARAELTAMRAALVEPRARVTISLIDRFEALLDVGHRIVRSLVADEIYTKLHDGALALLRAQHGAIIGLDASVMRGDPPAVSATLLTRSAREARPVVWSDVAETGTADEVLSRAAVRSALCAPVTVRGEVTALLYVTHSEIGGAFGDEELKIAAFLTVLAGAALENSEGFAHIEALSRELEQRVQARTAELSTANAALAENLRRLQLTQEQLVHAGRMAAVGTLIAGLSHELNNPLSVILGNIEHLQPVVFPDPRVARMIDAIARSGKRAARLVDTLLRFSRAKPNTLDTVNAAELIRVVVELVTAEARTRDIKLRVSVADGLPQLVVSKHDIESALVNLTTNALQATSAGGEVELGVVVQSRDSTRGVCFSVRDTGTGIAPDALAQIFDPFFTTKPEGQGTGLGLSLARQAAVDHGGTIDVESALGNGTTMRLWLPTRPTDS